MATNSEQHPYRPEARPPGQNRDEHRRQREDDAEQQPRRHEQLDRILEVEAQAIVAAAALGHEAQRQAHQGAEGRLDGADVDGGDRRGETAGAGES